MPASEIRNCTDLPWIGFGLLAVVAVLAFARRSHREMYDFEDYRVAGAPRGGRRAALPRRR